MNRKKYKVTWTEEHKAIVETDEENKAANIALGLDPMMTFVSQSHVHVQDTEVEKCY